MAAAAAAPTDRTKDVPPPIKFPGSKAPFYFQVTSVKEEYSFLESSELKSEIQIPLVTLPPGTVLFRGVKIPHTASGDDVRYFYRDFLGTPEGADQVCLTPTHNVFFYPTPYIAFGANNIGERFHSIQAVVLVHPVTIVCLIGPSPLARQEIKGFASRAPITRCDNFTDVVCHPLSADEKKAMATDNCINPTYAKEKGVRGWIGIADLDSINPSKLKKEKKTAEATMSTYIRALEGRMPGAGVEALSHTYTDKFWHIGFPEIALYPYREHPGNKLIKKACSNSDEAIAWMVREAKKDNLLYLPLATFTKDANIDMVNGVYSYDSLKVAADSHLMTGPYHQPGVETHLSAWLNVAMTEGLDLPFYGKGTLHFDTRTGFYCFPQLVPKNFKVPVPAAASSSASAKTPPLGSAAAAAAAAPPSEPYRWLLKPLSNEDEKVKMRMYRNIFRTFQPKHFMEMFGLAKKYGIRRAFIFERPNALKFIFGAAGFPEDKMPIEYKGNSKRAAELYQKETGIKPKAKEVPAAAAEAPLAGAAANAYAARQGAYTPPVGGYGSTTPVFNPMTGEYEVPIALAGGYGAATPVLGGYGVATPPLGGAGGTPLYAPLSPPIGGAAAAGGGGATPPYVPDSPPAAAPPPQRRGRVPSLNLGEPALPRAYGSASYTMNQLGGKRRKTRSRTSQRSRQTRKTPSSLKTSAFIGENYTNFALKFRSVWNAFAKGKN